MAEITGGDPSGGAAVNELTARPVRRERAARYPTKLEVLTRPEMLRRHLPPAWLGHAELAGAASLLLAANMAGCGVPGPPTTREEPAQWERPRAQPPTATTRPADSPHGRATARTPAVVAPIFVHGEGRGASGCIILVPPVYLSEEDAFQIIREEMALHGVNLVKAEAAPPNAYLPPRFAFVGVTGNTLAPEFQDADLGQRRLPDLIDENRRVAVEYVAVEDYLVDLALHDAVPKATVIEDHCRDMAQEVANRVQHYGQGVYFGAFYDPTTSPGRHVEDRDQAERDAREESKRLLREQVKDFADWLKAQGAI